MKITRSLILKSGIAFVPFMVGLMLSRAAPESKSHASTDGRLIITGIVQDFDRSIVKLKTEDSIIRVPRSKVMKEEDIRPGKVASAVVNIKDLYNLN